MNVDLVLLLWQELQLDVRVAGVVGGVLGDQVGGGEGGGGEGGGK